MPDPLDEAVSSLKSGDRIKRHAERTGLDPEFVKRVITQESGGKANARSWAGAGGTMQLMPGTAKRYGVKNVNDPEENIRGGTDYLRDLTNEFGDPRKVLAAYNAGEGAVRKHGYEKVRKFSNFPKGDPRRGGYVGSTGQYVDKILKGYEGAGYQDPLGDAVRTLKSPDKQADPLAEATSQLKSSTPIQKPGWGKGTIGQGVKPATIAIQGPRAQVNVPGRGVTTNLPLTNVDPRVLKGEQPSDPMAYARAQELVGRVEPRRTEEPQKAQAEREAMERDPAMIAARRRIGSIPGTTPRGIVSPRGVASALQRFGGETVKAVGGAFELPELVLGKLAESVGLPAPKVKEYLNTRGRILSESATMPLDSAGQAIERDIPEKVTEKVTGLGLSLAQIVLLKKATGLNLGPLMAIETTLKNSDAKPEARLAQAGEAYALGRILDGHFSRPKSAVAFSGPTAVQSGIEYARGNMSLEDALLNTGVEAVAGAALGGKQKGRRNAPQTETQPNITAQPESVGIREAQGAPRVPASEAGRVGASTAEPVSSQSAAVETPEVVRHVDLQPRRQRGEGKGQFKSETKAQREERLAQVSQPATENPAQAAQPAVATETTAPTKTGERAFQKSAKAAGLPQGTDLTYAVNTDVGAVERANQRIQSDGPDRVRRDLQSATEPSKDDIVTASIIAHDLTAKGDIKGAVDLVDDMARKLTSAGQSVQAASLISRLSPEGVLLAAQRRVPKGSKVTEVQGSKLIEMATKIKDAESKLASLEQRIVEMRTPKKPARIGTLEDRLIKMEMDARARLAERVGVGKGSEVGASTIPLDIADYAIIGAAKLARKGVTLAKWTDEMVKEFGEEIRPKLKAIYRESYKHYDNQRKQFAQEREIRSATKAEPTAKDIQAVINQRALARKDARTSRAELVRLFRDLSLTPAGKVKAVAGDILNVPRTMKSSVDLSAPRQGAMWMVNHPVQGAKVFFGKQLKAMRQVNYDRFVDQLESDPDYPLMTRSGLALTTTDVRPHSLSGREEAFMSRIASRIPGISHSERAYTTFLDTARSSWFKQLKTQAENRAKAQGGEVTPEQYQAIANFVNIATGRGNLGKGTLNKMSPFLNAVFFAPKFAASKVQIFDPRVYARLPPGARRAAMREAATYFGAMTTAALLLKYGMGAQVGTDPESSEFMKVRQGNTRYDLSNGTGQYITLASRLLRNAENRRTGKKDDLGKSIGANIDRFTRYKYSPPAAFARNVWEGKNAIGEKTSAGKEGLELVTPLFLKDLYDAYQDEGLVGVGKTTPGFVGVGVNTYSAKPIITKSRSRKLQF